MFSLEASPRKRKHGNIAPAWASLTDPLHLQPAAWRSSKFQVLAPRISAKRIPRQQLKVVPTQLKGPPAFVLNQHKRAVQAALGLRQEVSYFVLSICALLSNRVATFGLHVKSKHREVTHRQQHQQGLKLPWRRKSSQHSPNSGRVTAAGAAHNEAIAHGYAAEHALDMRLAVRCFEEVVRQLPESAQYRSMLSKQWTDCTYLDVGPAHEKLTDDDRRQFNQTALEHARQAIVLDGFAALPHIAACTSMGRLALLSDNKTKVKLAHDAREEAVTALALEPSNDLAHHLMGRWHFEMANLNVVVRTLVRVMYGTALASGSHHDALESYERAVALAPSRLIHRVELGRTLHRLGKKEQARTELEAAVQMEIEDINAYCQRQDALAMLKRMPAARRAPVPAIMESEPASNYASGHACDGPAVA
ncbi:hypothetical protein ABBQ32_011530 [Trebouxia sp. C0010 RCD-2024]